MTQITDIITNLEIYIKEREKEYKHDMNVISEMTNNISENKKEIDETLKTIEVLKKL